MEVIHAGIGGYTASTASKQKQHPKLIHELKLESVKTVNNTSRSLLTPNLFFYGKAYSLFYFHIET